MKAVILAAGEGKRLRPFTETMPKVMLPVANKPILKYIVDAVQQSGINDIILVVGYKKEGIMEYFKDYDDVNINYVEQDKQLGTGHALLQTKKLVKSDFIVISGDNIIDRSSISQIINHKSKYCSLIKQQPEETEYGVVKLEKKLLRDIYEKAPEKSKFISTGIYKLPRSIYTTLENLASQGIYSMTALIKSLINQDKEIHAVNADLWMEFVYPWDFIKVNEYMTHFITSSLGGNLEKNVILKGQVSVGKNTTIYSGCYIVGPVSIGEGCEIGPNTCIFPATTIGNNAVIQPYSQIRNSVIMDDVRIGSNSYMSNSIIGRGTILHNNFSADSGNATIEIETGLKKMNNIGAMIGEDCTIGSNVVIKPGSIIGRKCVIEPLKHIYKKIPSESNVM